MLRQLKKWLFDPTPAGLLVYITIIALIAALALLFCLPAEADLPAETHGQQGPTSEAVDEMSDAIQWLVTPPERFDEKRARVYYGTRAYTDAEYRKELSDSFLSTARYFNLPKYLLATIGYRESIFRPEQVGDGGNSLGIMQVGKYGRQKCKEYCGDVDTVNGGIMCGGCWLDKGRSWCGDLIGGLNAYCHGKCSGGGVSGRRAVGIRVRLWAILKNRYDTGNRLLSMVLRK